MKSVALSDAKARLSELIDEARIGGEPLVIRKRKKDVAVLLEVGKFRRLQKLEDQYKSLQLRKALQDPMYPLRTVLTELDLGV
ncbi:MAG: type II toxin-antitoxin system Phd/YefM family antitoxin [Armatimonadetes bacterium]|nr:type II toxin-antitoxin system Phd/YefM family antitoxin [Armatimonadota bacterium]